MTATNTGINDTDETRAPKKKPITQVEQHSGSLGHFNLDGETFNKLHRIEKYYSSLGVPVSLSVIVRRSIRCHYDYLNHIDNETDKLNESHLLFKAAKGT